MSQNFSVRTDEHLVTSINHMISNSSMIKESIFKFLMLGETLNSDDIKRFESGVNHFLKYWSDYADQIQEALKTGEVVKDPSGIQTVDFDHVKNWVYVDFDYASIIPFVDGIMQGVNSSTMQSPEDIQKFYTSTISMAFKNPDQTIGGILYNIKSDELGEIDKVPATELTMNQFESIRNKENLFNPKDRVELYESITQIVKFLTQTESFREKKDPNSARLFISSINNIIEYMSYSLTIYASRIFIIGKFVGPFLQTPEPEQSEPDETIVTTSEENPDQTEYSLSQVSGQFESGSDGLTPMMGVGDVDNIQTSDVTENPNGNTSNSMIGLNEMIIKNPNSIKEFCEIYSKFLENIGVLHDNVQIPKPLTHPRYFSHAELESNKIYAKLRENYLFNLVCYNRHVSDWRELHEVLKQNIFNTQHANSKKLNLKNDILVYIKSVSYGETLEDYKKLSLDLFMLLSHGGRNVTSMLDEINQRTVGHNIQNCAETIARKLLAQCSKFLIDFYQEFAFAIAQKAEALERCINKCKETETQRVIGLTSISVNVPSMKSDYDLDHMMNLSVPGTLRDSDKNIDYFALPIFQEREMYDEYLRSLPEFQNNWYLSEAGLSQIMNQIIAFIRARAQQLVTFVASEHFLRVRKWVETNQDKLQNLKHTQSLENVLPFQKDIKLQPIFESLSKVSTFNPQILNNEQQVEAFIKSLYPFDDQQYTEFINSNDKKAARTKFRNWILFGSFAEPQLKSVPINELPGEVRNWMEAVLNLNQESINGFKQQSKQIEQQMKQFNQNIVKLESVLYEQEESKVEPLPEGEQKNQSEEQTSEQKPQVQQVINRVNLAVNNIWGFLPYHIITAVRKQYGYLKQAYNNASVSGQTEEQKTDSSDQQQSTSVA